MALTNSEDHPGIANLPIGARGVAIQENGVPRFLKFARRRSGEFKSRMILQVHDELLFEAPEKELPRLRKLVKEVMEGVHKLHAPLVVDTKSGPNWRDMK